MKVQPGVVSARCRRERVSAAPGGTGRWPVATGGSPVAFARQRNPSGTGALGSLREEFPASRRKLRASGPFHPMRSASAMLTANLIVQESRR